MSRIQISLADEFCTWEELTRASSLVVLGKAAAQETVMDESVRSSRAPSTIVDSTITAFQVERLLIGTVPQNVRVLQPGGIGPDGTVWDVAHFPLFKAGNRYLLFLTVLNRPGVDRDLFAPTGAYQGVFSVDHEDIVNPLSSFGFSVENVPLEDVVAAVQRGTSVGSQ